MTPARRHDALLRPAIGASLRFSTVVAVELLQERSVVAIQSRAGPKSSQRGSRNPRPPKPLAF